MSKKSSNCNGASIGFFGLLTVLFIGLKLTGYIDWEWWWVLGPLWIPFSAVLVVLVAVIIICWLLAAVGYLLDRIICSFEGRGK